MADYVIPTLGIGSITKMMDLVSAIAMKTIYECGFQRGLYTPKSEPIVNSIGVNQPARNMVQTARNMFLSEGSVMFHHTYT